MAKHKIINGVNHRRAYINSRTGRFCKPEFAAANPDTTIGTWVRMSPGRPKRK